MSFNKLTPQEEERLAILLEEMGEAQQAIGKILRHGYESYNPDDCSAGSNRLQLQDELGDVLFAIQQICGGTNALDLDWDMIARRAIHKAKKIAPYLHHQAALAATEPKP